ncbi:MAG: hypothetical protein HQ528_05225, partial [Candidatus Marinimicrobia bacterium]|nr:hypothetical protein [Candidatus Neomarinimicrobiota bacterium]
EPTDDIDDTSEPIAIFLVTEVDTILLLVNNTYTLAVQGIFAETSENTVINTGVLAEASYTYLVTDTITESIDTSRPDWYSANQTVATVAAGKITGRAAGTTEIWAVIGEVFSDTLVVVISSPQLPPELILDPPPVQLVFQDSTTVSGRVTAGLDVTLTVAGDTIDYNENGEFSTVVSLVTGENDILVVAINNANGLSTTKSKLIVFYQLDQAGITGYWVGETLTRPFGFDIYELLGTYVIDGTMMVDFTMLGGELVVQDIIIFGQVEEDGAINASLSKEWDGFTITGTLEGIFLDSGMAEGTYGVKIRKEGWPTASASATWWARQSQ